MVTRASTTPFTPKYSVINTAIVANGGYEVMYLSRDRTTFYGRSIGTTFKNGLDKSTDGGVTWSRIRNLNSLIALNFNSIVETYDGEVLITMAAGGVQTRLYKSSGWAANPATCTFNLVLIANANFNATYCMHDQAQSIDGLVIASDEGPQTIGYGAQASGTGYTTATASAASLGGTGATFAVALNAAGGVERVAVLTGGTGYSAGNLTISGDGTGAQVAVNVSGGVITGANTGTARYVYRSLDYGATWTTIFDVYTTPAAYKYGIGLHIHGISYDPDWDRIWVCTGDATGDGAKIVGTGNTQLWYSDDRGATWKTVPIDLNCKFGQYTSVRATKNAVLLGTDTVSDTAIFVIPKLGYRVMGPWLQGAAHDHGVNAIFYGMRSAFSSNDSLPIFSSHTPTDTNNYPPILCSDDGCNWWDIWSDPDPVARPTLAYGGFEAFYGPDTSGRVITNYSAVTAGVPNLFVRGQLKTNY